VDAEAGMAEMSKRFHDEAAKFTFPPPNDSVAGSTLAEGSWAKPN
jgi:hypothetical protein